MSYQVLQGILIQFVILSVCACGIFYEALTGKNVGGPPVLILMGAFVVFGNGSVAYMMLKAKKREQVAAQSGIPAVKPATRAKRKQQRFWAMCLLFASGLALIVMGLLGRVVNIVPAHYIGAAFVIYGVAGLCGVNIWKNGPLDPDYDPAEPELWFAAPESDLPPGRTKD